jgi:hypothetical protein
MPSRSREVVDEGHCRWRRDRRPRAGFDNVDEVLSRDERQAIVGGYAGKAGFSTPEKRVRAKA